MTSALLVLAWAGAIAWPAVALAAFAVPRLRRSAIALGLALLATLAWAPAVWAFLIEPSRLVVREVGVASAAWRGPPVRVALISDVHVGVHMSPERIARVAERINALKPDLVLLAGDYVGGHVGPGLRSASENATIAGGLAALGGLDAPLGVVAVLGNHDWWYDGERVETTLAAAGVTVLENAALRIDRGEDRAFWIAGLADYHSERAPPRWPTAMAGIPEDADVLALAHWPDVFVGAPARVALTVAGHSHCGQLNLPLLGLPAVSPGSARWPCGLYREDGRALYVTGGLGVSILPARFRAPPEFVIITLGAAPDQ